MHDWRVVDDVPGAFVALLEQRRPRSVALSGGDTAHAAYEAAAVADIDWSATTFWFGDERWVSTDDPDSNEGMARRVWLDRVEVGGIVSLVNAGSDPEAAAANYDARLRSAGGVDLIHLGLGPDGHTASLFPGSPALDVTDHWVVAAGDDLHPHPRLTWTYPAIAAVPIAVITVVGVAKREALARVRAGDRTAPVTRVEAPEVIWLVDLDADA